MKLTSLLITFLFLYLANGMPSKNSISSKENNLLPLIALRDTSEDPAHRIIRAVYAVRQEEPIKAEASSKISEVHRCYGKPEEIWTTEIPNEDRDRRSFRDEEDETTLTD